VVSDITELIPNMITPNFDGKNDLWRLDFIQVFYPKAEIEIFSRWGVKLFRSEGYDNAWDGTYKGDPLPVGAYYYTIKLNDSNNTPVIKGTVTLLK
jgi:gliding motility-associated-like protein